LFKPKGKLFKIYLSEKEAKILDIQPQLKKKLMDALVEAKNDFFSKIQ